MTVSLRSPLFQVLQVLQTFSVRCRYAQDVITHVQPAFT